MSCPVLESLAAAVAAVEALPVPVGLGADLVLGEQVPAVAGAVARLQRELAVRMAALERADPRAADVRGEAQRAGVDPARARLLRHLGRFADEHLAVGRAWEGGSIRLDQVDALRHGARRVPAGKVRELVDAVLPLLPGLDPKQTQQVVAFAVDQLAPGDPDHDEITEHAARRLAWTRIPEGGLAFQGYLPAAEGAAFRAAIDALVESLRVTGDGLTRAQRRADALTTLVATATQHGLPTGGGLPAAMTLTVSLTEATRIALRDPAAHGARIRLRPHGGSTVDGQPVGDATVRFGMCCAAIAPILTNHPPQQARPPRPRDPLDPPDPSGWTHPVEPADPPVPRGPASWTDRANPAYTANSSDPASSSDPANPALSAGLRGRAAWSSGAGPAGRALGSLLDRIASTPVQPLAVGRSVRLATAAQRQALRVRDSGCAIPGCAVDAAYTQPHHVVGWAVGGTTDLDQMVSLCWVHHRMTELGRFQFVTRKDDEPAPNGALEHQQWWIIPPAPVPS